MPRTECFRIHNEITYVGKTIKASKRRVTWKFAFSGDSDEHSVVLVHTVNSGKKVVFLNGTQIHEEEKMSLSQWQYSFQLEGHLLTLVIEGTGTFSDERGYDLRVDGIPWLDLRITTLLDMRSGATTRGSDRGYGDRSSDSAWSRGGAVGGVPTSSAPSSSAWNTGEEAEPDVPVASLKDFLGTGDDSSRASKSKPSGGDWDPFSGAGQSKPATTNVTPTKTIAAPTHAPAPAAGHAMGLRPPPGGAGHRGSLVPHPAPAPATSITDDLAGLVLGGHSSTTAPRTTTAAPSFGFDDPFGAPAPAPAPAPAAGGVVDIFSMPFPTHALSGATSAPVPAPAPGMLEGGLINLDNLTETTKSGTATKAAPSLAQLKATTTVGGGPTTKPVMNVMGGTTGLGFSPLDLYTPAVPPSAPTPMFGGAPGYGAPYGAPQPNPYGAPPAGYGYPGAAPGYGYPPAGQYAPRPQAPAPAPAAYNPFE